LIFFTKFPSLQPERETKDEVVNEQERTQVSQLIERLELPELCYEERLGMVRHWAQSMNTRRLKKI